MVAKAKTIQELLEEIKALQIQLQESEETLDAIRRGEVDALVVNGPDGEQIFALEGADHPYRLMVETMSEGAVTVGADGTLIYCNQSFADMLGLPLERVVGTSLSEYIADADRLLFLELLETARTTSSKGEIQLRTVSGELLPSLFSLSTPHFQDAVCIVVTDLSEHRRNEELVLSQELARVRHEHSEAARRRIADVLESITDSFVAVDRDWRFTDVNDVAISTIFGKSREELIGKVMWSLHPELVNSETYRLLHAAQQSGEPIHFEALSKIADGKWFEAHAYPTDDGMSIYMRDITSRKIAEEEKRILLAREQAARSEAETANRLKDDFLATVSHELRNPLGAILGWANVLRSRQSEEHTGHAIEVIERNARLQLKLIEDLLDVSRIVSGKLVINFSHVSLKRIIEAAVEAAHPVAATKQITLTTNLSSETGVVLGDTSRLQQVVANLLSNAIKFTPAGGTVDVALNVENHRAVITVTDTGEGISADFLPYVFERFRQQDATARRMQGGLGLGLAIVRNIVEVHGGRVKAESLGSGQGAKFSVTLPLADDPIKAKRDNQVAEDADGWSKLSLAGTHVLLIDDEADGREFVKTVLVDRGAKITSVATAAEARSALEEIVPDVIICDIGLPSEDGYEFIRSVRGSSGLPSAAVPAVALTAYASADDQEKALTAGFQKHLAKPVEPLDLVRALAALMRREPDNA